jgi:hypothetical protein
MEISNDDYWSKVRSGGITAYYNDQAFLDLMKDKPVPGWARGGANPAPFELYMIGEHKVFLSKTQGIQIAPA